MGFGVIDPACRNDTGLKAEFSGQGQRLNIKAPAINPGLGKYLLRRFGRKGLKSALGVPNAWNGNELNKEIACIAQESFQIGLRYGLPRAGHVFLITRADDHVSAFREQRLHLIEVAHVRRIVGIGEEPDLSLGCQHAFSHRIPLASILFAVEPSNVLPAVGELLDSGQRLIVRPIQRHEDFPGEGLPRQILVHRQERGRNSPLFIVGRDYDAQVGISLIYVHRKVILPLLGGLVNRRQQGH